jgi:hypothetical protein
MKIHYYFNNTIFELGFAKLIAKTYRIGGLEFIRNMKLHNCYLSGSAILSILFQKNIHKGIDIFCSLDPYCEMFRETIPQEIKDRILPETRPVDFEIYLEKIGFKLISTNYSHPYLNVNYCRTYKKDKIDMPINIIRMVDNSTKKEVINNFDMSICMNYFDGKLYCANKRDLLEKKFTIFFKKDVHKSVYAKRMKKYKKMGFREGCRIDENYNQIDDFYF